MSFFRTSQPIADANLLRPTQYINAFVFLHRFPPTAHELKLDPDFTWSTGNGPLNLCQNSLQRLPRKKGAPKCPRKRVYKGELLTLSERVSSFLKAQNCNKRMFLDKENLLQSFARLDASLDMHLYTELELLTISHFSRFFGHCLNTLATLSTIWTKLVVLIDSIF